MKHYTSLFGRVLIAAMALAEPIGSLQAQSAEEFFRRANRLTLYVGSGVGGGYDQNARLVAANLPRFLPGHPSIVVVNMPTAAGIEANNFIFNSAPRDGTVLLEGVSLALALPVYGSTVAHYDSRQFEWIGSTSKNQGICVTWKTSEVKTLEDATKQVVTVASTTISQGNGVYPTLLNALFGTKFKVIPGYSTTGTLLAVERGEVEGLCGYSWETYQAIGSKWFVEQKVNILAQLALEEIADLPDVPKANDLLRNPDDKQVFDMVASPDEFGRPYLAPPGVPVDRMAVYREAFQAMLKDPQFLAEAKAQRIAIEPLNHNQIETLLARSYAEPKNIRERAAVFATGLK